VVELKYLGLDIGSLFSKAVVVEDEKLLSWAVIETTGKIDQEVQGLIDEVLDKGGLTRDDIDGTGLTGRGAKLSKVGVVRRDDISCIGLAVSRLVPQASMVLDIGGQSITTILLDEEGGIIDFMRNDKCASGSGKFLEVMGAALGVKVGDIDDFAERATKPVPVSSQCGVFVESELVTHVNEGEDASDIMAGICESVAKIVISQALKFGFQDDYTLTGGVGKLRSVTGSATRKIRGTYHPFPYDPQLAGAIGAALFAEED
jgi:predicted CoA-substrate-specific enzyme activase